MENIFLSVGAMKAGTTFLFAVLRQHPKICFTPEKELHYFAHIHGLDPRLSHPVMKPKTSARSYIMSVSSANSLKGKILSHDFRRHRLASIMRGQFSRIDNADELRAKVLWYADRYLIDPIDDHWMQTLFEESEDTYCSDFSNYNALLGQSAWQHVHSLASKRLRVLYVMRHPIDRLWSHYKFDSQLSSRALHSGEFSIEDAKQLLRNSSISAHSKYGDIVESLQGSLAPQELKLIFMEEFLAQPERYLAEIEEFMGLPAHKYEYDVERKSNPSRKMDLDVQVRNFLLRKLTPQMEKLGTLGVEVPSTYMQ